MSPFRWSHKRIRAALFECFMSKKTGFVLRQRENADLAMGRHTRFKDLDLDGFLSAARVHVGMQQLVELVEEADE